MTKTFTAISQHSDSVAAGIELGRGIRDAFNGEKPDAVMVFASSQHDYRALLQAISRGEFAIAGFRNRDIRRHLHPRTTSRDETTRLSARTSRRLRLLRAHHIIRKIHKTHRYVLTEHGQLLSAAIFAVRQAPLETLLAKAA